jgi:hypothetical protein
LSGSIIITGPAFRGAVVAGNDELPEWNCMHGDPVLRIDLLASRGSAARRM